MDVLPFPRYNALDEVALELDLENGGTLSAFKNGVRLGVIDSGLEGEFCWMAELGEPGDAVAICHGTLAGTRIVRDE